METETTPSARIVPFEFRGSGAEYFRIWSVNLLLTVVTIGIYSAWAKVRRLRYFYGSTRLDGHAFEYHAAPLAILKGRLIAFGLYVAYAVIAQVYPEGSLLLLVPLAFVLPWVVMRSRKFHMRMSSWRGLRFDFHGDYRGALKAYVGWLLAAVLTLYILFPVYLRERIAYALGNSAYGSQPFRFTTAQSVFWGFGLATVGLVVLLVIGWSAAVGIVAAMAAIAGEVAKPVEGGPSSTLVSAVLVATLGLIVVGLAVAAYYSRSVTNAAFGGLEIGPHRLQSTLRTAPLFGLYLKNFILVVLTLGIYYPWAKVATVRYQFAHTALLAHGDLDDLRAAASAGGTATGEEISDFFDVDFGL
jgi:uncharacterized membrane protein YjgN (DUF898 family)